jgi:FPC/CPF motif-containing protein YcgG
MLYGLDRFAYEAGADVRPLPEQAWFQPAAMQLCDVLADKGRFPCYFATGALERGSLLFTEVSAGLFDGFVSDLRTFLSLRDVIGDLPVLVAYWKDGLGSLAQHEAEFWHYLCCLQNASSTQSRADWNEEDWRFVFDDEALFINGHSPFYERRLSRRSPLHPMMVIQSYKNLEQIGSSPTVNPQIAGTIRALVDRYDKIPRAPYLANDAADWRQFWLLDHNHSDQRDCPLAGTGR